MKKTIKILLGTLVGITLALVIAFKIVTSDIEFGGDPIRDRAEILNQAPNFKDGHFHNTLKERDASIWVNIKDRWNSKDRFPPKPLPTITPEYSKEVKPGLRAVWFGHASVLVEIDGYRIFFDPVLSEYAFPVQSIAPKRQTPSPLDLKDLPKIDAAFISHDHYDHLDMKTIQHLSKNGTQFFVGLGVGAHIDKWGVPKEQINEMNWGDSFKLKSLSIHCTEARHYSGRKSMSSDTLWTSWVVQGPRHSVFHSGDSGYSPHFKQIGDRFKTIDLSLIKIGDYGLDLGWQDIHMVPENSIRAHQDVGAKLMLPIHWGVFILSNHPWNEPIERALKAAQEKEILMATPKIGEEIQFGRPLKNTTWWREVR